MKCVCCLNGGAVNTDSDPRDENFSNQTRGEDAEVSNSFAISWTVN